MSDMPTHEDEEKFLKDMYHKNDITDADRDRLIRMARRGLELGKRERERWTGWASKINQSSQIPSMEDTTNDDTE